MSRHSYTLFLETLIPNRDKRRFPMSQISKGLGVFFFTVWYRSVSVMSREVVRNASRVRNAIKIHSINWTKNPAVFTRRPFYAFAFTARYYIDIAGISRLRSCEQLLCSSVKLYVNPAPTCTVA